MEIKYVQCWRSSPEINLRYYGDLLATLHMRIGSDLSRPTFFILLGCFDLCYHLPVLIYQPRNCTRRWNYLTEYHNHRLVCTCNYFIESRNEPYSPCFNCCITRWLLLRIEIQGRLTQDQIFTNWRICEIELDSKCILRW